MSYYFTHITKDVVRKDIPGDLHLRTFMSNLICSFVGNCILMGGKDGTSSRIVGSHGLLTWVNEAINTFGVGEDTGKCGSSDSAFTIRKKILGFL